MWRELDVKNGEELYIHIIEEDFMEADETGENRNEGNVSSDDNERLDKLKYDEAVQNKEKGWIWKGADVVFPPVPFIHFIS